MVTTPVDGLAMEPPTVHSGIDDRPWVGREPGNQVRLLQVDLAQGVWTLQSRFEPGIVVQTHKHTGHVHAFTQSGSWHYRESPEQVSTAGSYLFEPAGSVHTLVVPEDNDEPTDIWFTIQGANLNLDADGNVELVIDAAFILTFYAALCEQQHGLVDPPVVRVGVTS